MVYLVPLLDYNSDMNGFIDQLEIDKLLSLLDQTPDLKSNHPLLGFLRNFNIGPGNHKVKFLLLRHAFESNTKRSKSSNKQIKDLIPDIKFEDGYLFLNKNTNQIRKLIKLKKTQIDIHLKNKFEYYIQSENIKYTESYDFYIEWVKEKRLTNPIDELVFKKLCKLYFKESV